MQDSNVSTGPWIITKINLFIFIQTQRIRKEETLQTGTATVQNGPDIYLFWYKNSHWDDLISELRTQCACSNPGLKSTYKIEGGYVFSSICVFVCLSAVYNKDSSKSYEWIFVKLGGDNH